jgi:hypothetical protein
MGGGEYSTARALRNAGGPTLFEVSNIVLNAPR